jgi:hypothetical protein
MNEPLTFVSWRWRPKQKYRSTFGPETVFALREMIAKHYRKPHRFVCVTDRPEDLPGIETIPLWADACNVPSPIGHSYPSCYRRLKVFAPDAGKMFGPRLVSMDLDTVITGDIAPLFDRPEDFVIWGESDFPHTTPYCGSMWMLRTGTRPSVWTQFDETTSPSLAMRAGCRGSDQGWLSFVLGKGEATWSRKDGVYSYRKHLHRYGHGLPSDARIVFFHGKHDPWSHDCQKVSWIREHYPTVKVAA